MSVFSFQIDSDLCLHSEGRRKGQDSQGQARHNPQRQKNETTTVVPPRVVLSLFSIFPRRPPARPAAAHTVSNF